MYAHNFLCAYDITEHPSCQFVPSCKFCWEQVDGYINDHRSQMMIFCGHEDWCSQWNTKFVLEAAKHNVDKMFQVVGGTYLPAVLYLYR